MQEVCVGLRYERNQVDKLSTNSKVYMINILTDSLHMSLG